MGPDGIKDLAWNHVYELGNENGTFTKKNYKKTGLKTYELKETFTKSSLSGEWVSDSPAQTAELEGSGSEYYTMAPSVLSFRSTAPLDEFQEVQVNGQTIDPSNYTLEEGSTIVKLSHEYLKTLDVGGYELSVVSDNQTAKGNFTIAAPKLNEYGFYYNQPYCIENSWVGATNLNEAYLNGVVMFASDGVITEISFETEGVSHAVYTKEDNLYTFSFMGATLTGSFTPDGRSFITNKVFMEGWGWAPDYNGTDVLEFKLDYDRIACDLEYLYFVEQYNKELIAVPIEENKSSYMSPKTTIKDEAVIRFGEGAFVKNTKLLSMDFIPESFTKIAEYTFGANMISVTIPSGIKEIDTRAFKGCNKLVEIRNLSTVTINTADYDLSNIENIYTATTGKSNLFNTVDGYWFYDASSMCYLMAYTGSSTELTLPTDVNGKYYEIYRHAFDTRDDITKVSFSTGAGKLYIGKYAFGGCHSITSIDLPAVYLTNCVFSDCASLKEVVLQSVNTSLSYNAFINCPVLESIRFSGTIAQWNAVEKHDSWCNNVPATYVQCSDGQVAI